MAPAAGWALLQHIVTFKQRLLKYQICLASMATADWVGSAADTDNEVFWNAMEAQSVVVHPRDLSPFEISIFAERMKYCNLSLRWLEPQGELPSTPNLFRPRRGLQTKGPTRAPRDRTVHAPSIGLP